LNKKLVGNTEKRDIMRAADIMSDCPNLCKDGSTELKKQKIGATDLLQIQQILPFPCLEKLQSPQ
jgi:hypothetical protein